MYQSQITMSYGALIASDPPDNRQFSTEFLLCCVYFIYDARTDVSTVLVSLYMLDIQEELLGLVTAGENTSRINTLCLIILVHTPWQTNCYKHQLDTTVI